MKVVAREIPERETEMRDEVDDGREVEPQLGSTTTLRYFIL